MKKIKVRVEAEGILADHMVRRLEGLTGPRDKKDLAQLIIEADRNPKITVVSAEKA